MRERERAREGERERERNFTIFNYQTWFIYSNELEENRSKTLEGKSLVYTLFSISSLKHEIEKNYQEIYCSQFLFKKNLQYFL
jgi:hypothetical protein